MIGGELVDNKMGEDAGEEGLLWKVEKAGEVESEEGEDPEK